jgi:hypothetical protein
VIGRWLALVVAGSLLCTFGDHLHATHGVLFYPHVALWSQAWWVPLLFAVASIAAVAAAWPWIPRQATTPGMGRIVVDGAGFLAAYAYTSFAPAERPNVTLAVLVVAFAVRVLGERRPAWLVLHCLLLSIGGVITEWAISSTGAFFYRHPDFLMTPRWLGGIYLHAGLVSGAIAVRLLPIRK